eukprot:scaffold1736_cov127-Cylindrotheca_fusiformis.AAC.67
MSEDSEYESSDGFIDEYMDDDGDEISIDDLLRHKLDRIAELELESSRKDKELAEMRHTVVRTEVNRKKELYLIKLDLETCRREKDATEERLAEVYDDLNHLLRLESNRNDTSELEAVTQKCQEVIAIRDSQLQMVQTSCGEIVRTLKEEIEDLMEERHRMELDLLNQLSILDTDRQETEAYLLRRVEEKEEALEMLRRRGRDGESIHSSDIEDLEDEISTLALEKKNLEEALILEQEKSDEEIRYLEHSNSILEEKIQALTIDIAVLRSGSEGGRIVVDPIAKREEELGSFIDKVSAMREQTNESVEKVEQAIARAKPNDEASANGDTNSILSIFKTASLIYDQVNLSMRLIEIELQNRLKVVRNEKFGNNVTASKDIVLLQKMKEIQTETMTAISETETTLSDQIHQREVKTIEELQYLKYMLERRKETLQGVQAENESLQQEVAKLKAAHPAAKEGESQGEEKTSEGEVISVSKSTIDQLEIETLRIAEVVKTKNETIKALSNELSRHRIRENEMKEQLDRSSAFPPQKLTIQRTNIDATIPTEATTPSSSPKEKARRERSTIAKKARKLMIQPLRSSPIQKYGYKETI